jgi:hypothetical protein
MESYLKVKNYVLDLGYTITYDSAEENVLVIQKEAEGISNMVLGIADPILIAEQFLFEIKHASADMYKNLLQKNRDVIHGAFVLDESGEKVIFRDTLQLENLDLNELEATLNSLSLLLSEYSEEIINYSK